MDTLATRFRVCLLQNHKGYHYHNPTTRSVFHFPPCRGWWNIISFQWYLLTQFWWPTDPPVASYILVTQYHCNIRIPATLPQPNSNATSYNKNPQLLSHPVTARSREEISKHVTWLNLHTSTISHVPKNLHMARFDRYWFDVMTIEFRALLDNETWELVHGKTST